MPDTHQQDLVAALHYPVPDLVNNNGINYRDAIIMAGLGLLPDGRRTILDSINPAEELLIDTGELYEHRLTQTVVLSQSEIEGLYISEQQTVFDFLQSELQNFEEIMASYIDLFDLRSNSVLINRIAVAVTIKAQTYIDGATPTTDELVWASRVLVAPRPEAQKLLHYLVAVDNTATIAQITGASDSAIQTRVDAGADALVTGGIT